MKKRPFIEAGVFKLERQKAALTTKAAAALLKVSERTVRNWEAGRSQVPYSAFKLLCIEGGYELPGDAWRGFVLRGDTIWSPEGKAFSAHDLAWWSLTCALARERLERVLQPLAASNQSVPETMQALPRGADRREATSEVVEANSPPLQNRFLPDKQQGVQVAPPSPINGLILPARRKGGLSERV